MFKIDRLSNAFFDYRKALSAYAGVEANMVLDLLDLVLRSESSPMSRVPLEEEDKKTILDISNTCSVYDITSKDVATLEKLEKNYDTVFNLYRKYFPMRS